MMDTKLLETDQHDAPSLEERQNQKRQIALALKFAAVVLLLWIPLNLIQNLLSERCERQCEAVADISSSWGGAQNLVGPVLTIPAGREQFGG